MKDDYNGYLIQRDSDNIADLLTELIHDKTKIKKMGINSIKTAKNFSWEKIAKQTLDYYEEILKK